MNKDLSLAQFGLYWILIALTLFIIVEIIRTLVRILKYRRCTEVNAYIKKFNSLLGEGIITEAVYTIDNEDRHSKLPDPTYKYKDGDKLKIKVDSDGRVYTELKLPDYWRDFKVTVLFTLITSVAMLIIKAIELHNAGVDIFAAIKPILEDEESRNIIEGILIITFEILDLILSYKYQ